MISRVAKDIYARLETDPVFGVLKPSTEVIAQAIAKRDRARIISTGSLALNTLGLSTQIPMNAVYLIDGAALKIDLSKRKIIFKKTNLKNLSAIGQICSLVIQAVREIGKDHISENEKQIIFDHLKNEDSYRLEHNIK